MRHVKILLGAFTLLSFLVSLPHVKRDAKDKTFLYPVYVGAQGGYINENGKIIIPPQFGKVGEFYDDLAAVMVDGKWGYIDRAGNVAITPRFDAANKFSEGMAVVLIGGEYGYIDASGKITITPQFQKAGNFYEGLARVRIKNGWGYVNKSGEVVIPADYDYADDFHEGFAVIARGNGDGTCRVGYINKLGAQAFGKWFVNASQFSGGVAITSNDKAGFSTISHGELAFDNYDMVSGVQKLVRFEIIDSGGTKVFEGHFQDADVFSEGLAIIRLSDKYGFINSRGMLVIRPQFDAVGRFSEGLALVSLDDKRFYVNRAGETSFSTSYSDNLLFANGLAFVKDCSDHVLPCKGGYVNKNGETVWVPTR